MSQIVNAKKKTNVKLEIRWILYISQMEMFYKRAIGPYSLTYFFFALDV